MSIKQNNLKIDIHENEIKSIFSPFVQHEMPVETNEWAEIRKRQEIKQRRKYVKRKYFGWLRGVKRTQKAIKKSYSSQWKSFPLSTQLSAEGPGIECEWGDKGLIARAIGIKRVHLLYLMKIISTLQPKNILEVGFGNGVNLFVLSSRFPEIEFSGIELTEGGVQVASEIQSSDVLPDYISEFSPENIVDIHAHKKLDLLQGNATDLVFENNQFDMVYTNLALEQMNEVKEKALSEITRVTSKYVVMVEPFFDWNNEGINKYYIKANDYFSATLEDLKKYNLEVIYTNTDLPHKLTFTPGIVVAKKII